MNNLISQKFIN